jgi:hypothetical protein
MIAVRRVLAGVAVALAVAGCSATPSSAPLPHFQPPIPTGWKTYTYSGAAISVPPHWTVRHNNNCPDPSAPGTLLLGFPRVLASCVALPACVTSVALTTLSNSGVAPQRVDTPTRFNDLTVYEGMDTPSCTDWEIPSLNLRVTGGAGTVAVVRTLRRA